MYFLKRASISRKNEQNMGLQKGDEVQKHLAQDHGVIKEKHFKQELVECRRDWQYPSAPQTD